MRRNYVRYIKETEIVRDGWNVRSAIVYVPCPPFKMGDRVRVTVTLIQRQPRGGKGR